MKILAEVFDKDPLPTWQDYLPAWGIWAPFLAAVLVCKFPKRWVIGGISSGIFALSIVIAFFWLAVAYFISVGIRLRFPVLFSLICMCYAFLLLLNSFYETFSSPYAFKGNVYSELGPSLFINDLISISIFSSYFVLDFGIRILKRVRVWIALEK